MPPPVASALCILFILGLCWLDREEKVGISSALWIPVIWLTLASSRSVAQWLSMAPSLESTGVLEGNPLDRIVYSALLIAGAGVLIARAKKTKLLLRKNPLIVTFLALCIVSLLWSDFPDVAFKRWLKALGDFVCVLVVLTEVDPLAAFRRFLSRVAFLLMPFSIVLIKYYPAFGRTYGRWFGEVHYTGVTTNKNTLGSICLIFGLLTLWRLLALFKNREQIGRRRMLIANGVIFAIILWLLALADSMTSFACFVMGGSLILLLNMRFITRRLSVLHILVPGMMFASFAVLFLNVFPYILNAMGKSTTLTDRTEIWPLLLSFCKNPVVGTGFGSYWLGSRLENIWSVYKWKPNQAHNGYLEIYLNLGWVGVVLLAGVLVTGYGKVCRACRRNVAFGSLLLSYFVAGLVYNFTEAAFFQILAPVWIVFLLAIVSHAVVPEPAQAQEEPITAELVEVAVE